MKQEIKERIELINKGIVPAGYKKTPVGICPVEWIETILGKICEINPKTERLKSTFQYIDLESIVNGKVVAIKMINKQNAPSRAQRVLSKNDIIYQLVRPYQKNNFLLKNINENQIVASTGYAQLRCKNPEFIYNLINTDYFCNQVLEKCTGTNYPAITSGELYKILVNIPINDTEQQKIAEILNCATRQVELQEQLVDKLKVQKKALMQKLLTPQPDWQEVKLGDVVTYASSGGTPKTDFEEYYNGNIVWVSIDDITKCQKYIENSSRKITDLGLKNSSTKLLNPNTILFAMYASIGKCAISKVLCTTSQAILGLVANEKKVGYEYLYYTLCFMEDSLKLLGQKGSQSNLNKQMVLNFNVFLPNLKEQNEITNILKNIDKQIELQQKLLEQYKLRKKALMQLLLTGIVRVC